MQRITPYITRVIATRLESVITRPSTTYSARAISRLDLQTSSYSTVRDISVLRRQRFVPSSSSEKSIAPDGVQRLAYQLQRYLKPAKGLANRALWNRVIASLENPIIFQEVDDRRAKARMVARIRSSTIVGLKAVFLVVGCTVGAVVL